MSKKLAITIIASEETFHNLSTFTTIGELNETVRHYKEKFKDKLTKSTVAVLDLIKQYSCKYIGVSFRTKNNIAESLNISRKTVQRACNLLEDLGVIKQLEMKRKSDMRQTSNAIQIMPISENVQQDKPEMSSQKDNISLKQNIKNINTIRTEDKSVRRIFASSSITLSCANWINKDFAKHASYYFSDNDTEELFRIATIHGRINKLPSETLKKVFMDALKCLIYKIKYAKVKSSIMGYFNGVIKKLSKKYAVNDLFLSVFDA